MVLLVKPMTVTKAAKTMSAVKSMKAVTAMRAMKTKPTTMSAYEAYSTTAEMVGLAPKQVKGIVEVMMALAATQVQSVGSFKLAGAINITLKKNTCNDSTERCALYYNGALSFQGEESVAEMADHCHEGIRPDGDVRRLYDRMR